LNAIEQHAALCCYFCAKRLKTASIHLDIEPISGLKMILIVFFTEQGRRKNLHQTLIPKRLRPSYYTYVFHRAIAPLGPALCPIIVIICGGTDPHPET